MPETNEPLKSVLVFFSPKELEKMARREYQDPPLKKTSGQNARWFIRVRKRVVTGDGIKTQTGQGISRLMQVHPDPCSRAGPYRQARRD